MADKTDLPQDQNSDDAGYSRNIKHSQAVEGTPEEGENAEALTDVNLINAGQVENESDDDYVEEGEFDFNEDEDTTFTKVSDDGSWSDEKNWVTQFTAALNNVMTLDDLEEESDEEAMERLRQQQEEAREQSTEQTDRMYKENIDSGAAQSDIQHDIMSSQADPGQGIIEIASNLAQSSTEASATHENFISIDDVSSSGGSGDLGRDILNEIGSMQGPAFNADIGPQNDFGNSHFVDQHEAGVSWNGSVRLMMRQSDWTHNPKGFENVTDMLGIHQPKMNFEVLSDLVSKDVYSDQYYTYTTTYYEDGTVVYEDSDGWTSVNYPDGSYESMSSDGSWYSAQLSADGEWEYSGYDAITDIYMRNDLIFDGDGDPILNADGEQMTSNEYWDTYYGNEYDEDYSYDYTEMLEEMGYSLNDDGIWEIEYEDGSTSWQSADGSEGGYTDAVTGWESRWDESGFWYETPEGVVWTETETGFQSNDGTYLNFEEFYDHMNESYQIAWENRVEYEYDSTGSAEPMEIESLNYYDTVTLDGSFADRLNLDDISLDDISNTNSIQYAIEALNSGGTISLSELSQAIENFVVNSIDDMTENTRFILQDDGSVLFDADGSGQGQAEEVFSVTDGGVTDMNIMLSSNYNQWLADNGYTQQENGIWEIEYDDGSVAWQTASGSEGGYTDVVSGWESHWDSTGFWYETPDGTTWTDTGTGYQDDDGNFESYETIYDQMNQDVQIAWENRVEYEYDSNSSEPMEITSLNYFDTVTLDESYGDSLNLDGISQDAITDEATLDWIQDAMNSGGSVYLSDLNFAIENFVVENTDDADENTRFILQDDGTVLFDADGSGEGEAEEVFKVTDGDVGEMNIVISSSDPGDGLSS